MARAQRARPAAGRPRGGGTLVVEGSHRLAAAYPGAPSRTVRGQLSQQDPWLREIWHPAGRVDRIAALMDHGAEVAGVRLRVAELNGAPGDVVLWHPALFHAAAPNTARHPRFMLTHTALRRARRHRLQDHPGASTVVFRGKEAGMGSLIEELRIIRATSASPDLRSIAAR